MTPKQARNLWSLRLLEKAGVCPTLAEIKEMQISEDFLQKMRNRAMFAFFRYGGSNLTNGLVFDQVEEAGKKITRYLRTGNTENLVDAANYCMVAYMSDNHPDKHFESQDDSPHATRLEP